MRVIFNIKNKNFLFLILLLIIVYTSRVFFLPGNISFNNDAPVYSENIEKNFFDGTYSVHTPGYISFIYLGRFFYLFIKNTIIIQHIINLILVFFITVFFYNLLDILGFKLFDNFLFSIIFSSINIYLLGSITGGNRLFLLLACILAMYFAVRIVNEKDNKWLLIIFSVVFAFFIGFRQDLSFYFFPLYFYLIYKVRNIKYIFISLGLFTIVCLTWFIPLMIEYGGFFSFLEAVRNSESVSGTSIIFSGIKLSPVLNIIRLFIYIFNGFLFIFPFFIYSLVKKEYKISNELLIILCLSFFPSFLFQLLIHNGNFVHLTSFLAPLFVFFILNFKFNSNLKIGWAVFIIICLFIQFYGIRMLDISVPEVVDAEYFENKILANYKTSKQKEFLEEKFVKKGDKYYLIENYYNKKKLYNSRRKHLEAAFYLSGYKFYKRMINVLFLQYTYDGARKGRTYRLKILKLSDG